MAASYHPRMAQPWWREHLACPDCQRPLDGDECPCGFHADGRDFRPQHPQRRTITFTPGTRADLANVNVERPKVTYDGPRATRDSSELFSAAQPWIVRDAKLLDLGCGPRDQAIPATHVGAQYAGLDYTSAAADLLGDAHAIPFRDATFDVVLSYAVLEHLQQPFVAVQEIARVLRSGGVFVGTVSQGEPFHDSYFHHTAWGALSVFASAALHPLRLWSSYDTLHALSRMGRYPRAIRIAIEAVHRITSAAPFLAPRKFLKWTARERELDELYRAASICFLAQKS